MLAGQNDKRYIVDARKWHERGIQKRQNEEPSTVEPQRMPESQ